MKELKSKNHTSSIKPEVEDKKHHDTITREKTKV